MAKKLETRLSKKDLGDYLVSVWDYTPDGIYGLNPSIILYCDAALQLKEKRYEAVTAIKRAGVPCAKIFEMMGYAYSEIDFSHHKRRMEKPEISEEELQKIAGKKVILTDVDFVTGKTLRKVTEYLRNREVNVRGAFIEFEDWPGRSNFGPYKSFWRDEKKGLRILNNPDCSKIPGNFKVYTSTTRSRIDEAATRVLKCIEVL